MAVNQGELVQETGQEGGRERERVEINNKEIK